MKHYITLATLILPLSIIYCQSGESKFLNVNEVFTTLNEDGGLFWDGSSSSVYKVPYTSEGNGANAIFAGNIWMCMYDDALNPYGSVATYSNNVNAIGKTPGMLDQSTGQPFVGDPLAIGRVFSVYRFEIEGLLADLSDGILDSEISKDILEWPARGNQYYSGMLDDQSSAPFFDQNGDGVYSPTEGDHPIIEGNNGAVVPDQLLYHISNDYGGESSAGIELHTVLYAFYCTDNNAVNQSVFQKHIIYNRSARNYSDIYFGHWMDYDLGCGEDDKMACSPDDDIMYVYNSDNLDGDAGNICTTGARTYEDRVFNGCKVLGNELKSCMVYGRANSNLANAFELNNINQLANLLQGKWSDGTPITMSGDGYNPTNPALPTTSYMYSDHPNDENGWHTTSSDYRALSSQYVSSLSSGGKIVFDLVNTFTQSQDLDHLEIIDFGIDRLNQVGQFYESGYQSDCTSLAICQDLDCIYPGDINNDEEVNVRDYMLGTKAIVIDNLLESPRSFISDVWNGFFGEDRTHSFATGTNYKHVDCNGDGEITSKDLEVVQKNYSKKGIDIDPIDFLCAPYGGDGHIELSLPTEILSSADALSFCNISVEGFSDIYSLTCTIEYDREIFSTGLGEFSVLGFNIFDSSVWMYHTGETGREVYAASRSSNDNTPITDYSTLFRLAQKGGINVSTTQIKITDIMVMDFDEKFYCLEDRVYTLDFSDITNTLEFNDEDTHIYPNPTNGLITIETSGELSSYAIYRLDGQRVESGSLTNHNTIQADYLSGIYHLVLTFQDGSVWSERVVVH